MKYGGMIFEKEEREAIDRVLEKNLWLLGEETKLFEKELAEITQTKQAVFVNSGSSALLLAFDALPKGEKKEVIIPATLFPTAVTAIQKAGLTPIVVDSREDTLCIDEDEVDKAVNENTLAILSVHVAGLMPDLDRLRKHDCYLIVDNCFVAGTKVLTNVGEKNIEDIQVGDQVMTRGGYRKVTASKKRGEREVITKLGITATPEHPFITVNDGVKRFDALTPSDILHTWNEKQFRIEEQSITDILKQKGDITGYISFQVKECLTIGRYGLTTMGRYLKGVLSTIKTATRLTTSYQISSLLPQPITQGYTGKMKAGLKLHTETSGVQEKKPRSGTGARKAESGIASTASDYGLIGNLKTKYARFVLQNIKHIIKTGLFTVQQNAKKVPVYDLTVEGRHEFFANGVLVHNCDGFGGKWKGKPVESYADMAVTSFHAAHIISTGQGGAVFSNNEKVRELRDWGRMLEFNDDLEGIPPLPKDFQQRYTYASPGYNLSPLELQAAVGREQLKKLDRFIEARKHNHKYLSERVKYDFPKPPKGADCVWFTLPLLSEDRPEILKRLRDNGIEYRNILAGNITLHPAFRELKTSSSLKGANEIARKGFWISVHPSITKEQMDNALAIL